MRAFHGVVLALAAGLAGCQLIGPEALQTGRVNYNNVIQQTSKEQVFANLIRVHNSEPTLFIDVSEVDATLSFQTTATASLGLSLGSGKNGSTHTASAAHTSGGGATIAYSETPTIRYLPLLGQPLVQQMVAPISVESLAYLFQSDWSPAAVLQLSVDRITPRFEDYGAALNAIVELDEYNALVMAAYPSSILAGPKAEKRVAAAATAPKGGAESKKSESGGGGGSTSLPNDALILYLQPDHPSIDLKDGESDVTALREARRTIMHLWIRLLRMYEDTQPMLKAQQKGCYAPGRDLDKCLAGIDSDVNMSDADLIKNFSELPSSIELRTQPIPPIVMAEKTNYRSAAPILRTRSAMGVLKASAAVSNGIKFLPQADYDAVNKEDKCSVSRHYYVLPPLTEEQATQPGGITIKHQPPGTDSPHCLSATLNTGAFDTDNYHALDDELHFMAKRKYILIATSDGPAPDDAYVSYEDNGMTYYIAGNDLVSKLNFTLLAQLLIMQAVQPQTQPLTPVIPVGG